MEHERIVGREREGKRKERAGTGEQKAHICVCEGKGNGEEKDNVCVCVNGGCEVVEKAKEGTEARLTYFILTTATYYFHFLSA